MIPPIHGRAKVARQRLIRNGELRRPDDTNCDWCERCMGPNKSAALQMCDGGLEIVGGHPGPSRMTIPRAIAVSLIVAVCAAATGRVVWSVIEFVYRVL